MTKKTRIRIARIAAGAVIAAGASLTAAGAASALDVGVQVGGLNVGASADKDGVEVGLNVEDPTTPAPTPTEPEEPTVIPTDPTEEPPTEEPPTEEPTEEPTEPTDEPTVEPSDPGNGNGGSTGGNDTDPDGGSQPVEQGAGKESLTDTGSDTSAQGTGGELAETGAAENITYLLIGAGTMIAGGIGFRMLPRLMNGRGAAA
ncbi:LPXTG cell wall anchor domain-containing protein [Streptomyces phaeochromogenes]